MDRGTEKKAVFLGGLRRMIQRRRHSNLTLKSKGEHYSWEEALHTLHMVLIMEES